MKEKNTDTQNNIKVRKYHLAKDRTFLHRTHTHIQKKCANTASGMLSLNADKIRRVLILQLN